MNALFGRFGVVVVDGDDPALKRAFAPIMQEELLNEVAARSVRYANEKLEPHYTIQAHVRDLNLFHMRPSSGTATCTRCWMTGLYSRWTIW